MKVTQVEVPQERRFVFEVTETEFRTIVAATYHCTEVNTKVDEALRAAADEHDVRGWRDPQDARMLGVNV